MSEYDFTVSHIPGLEKIVVDFFPGIKDEKDIKMELPDLVDGKAP